MPVVTSGSVRRPSYQQSGAGAGNGGMGLDGYSLGASGGFGGLGQHAAGGQSQDWQGGYDNRIGSANYGAFNSINNWLSNAPAGQSQQRAAYLRSMGIMPTYNGQALDSLNAGNTQPAQFTQGVGMGGTKNYNPYSDAPETPDQQAAWYAAAAQRGWGDLPGGGSSALGQGGAPGSSSGFSVGGAGASLGGLTGKSIAGGGDLSGAVGGAYGGLIARGGSPFSAEDRTRMEQTASDTASRATTDAVTAARLAALRSGRTLGPEAEARLRMHGAAGADRARFETRTGLAQGATQNLLGGLQGAGNFMSEQQRNEILYNQLAAQNGLSGVNLMLGMGQ